MSSTKLYTEYRPQTPDSLRKYLRDTLTDEQLRGIAGADWGRAADENFHALRQTLACGDLILTDGNLYECMILQPHYSGPDKPLRLLMGSWWIGRFCCKDEYAVLLDNFGVGQLVWDIVDSCKTLDVRASRSAMYFLLWLRQQRPERDWPTNWDGWDKALRSLKSVIAKQC